MSHDKLKQTDVCHKQIYRLVSYIWTFTMYARKSVFGSLQSDQQLCYSLIRKSYIWTCYKQVAFLLLVSVADETDLSLTESETLNIGYVASGPPYPMGLNRPTSSLGADSCPKLYAG